MNNMISKGYNNLEFWTEYLNYVKLFTIKNYEDFIMLKSNIQILDKKVKGIECFKETLLFLENRYEREDMKSIEKL